MKSVHFGFPLNWDPPAERDFDKKRDAPLRSKKASYAVPTIFDFLMNQDKNDLIANPHFNPEDFEIRQTGTVYGR